METQTKHKGVKTTLVELAPQTSIIFPRPKYSIIRSTLSTLKIEQPEHAYHYVVVENGIEVFRTK